MMIVMTPHATPEQIDSVLEHIKTEGFQPHRSDGKEQTVIGVVGIVDRDVDPRQFEVLDGVAKVVRISSPFKLASRQFKEEDTIVDVGKGVKVGGREVVLMAGPCTIEIEGAGRRHRADRGRGGRAHHARRRVQAADLAVRVPGHGRGGTEDPPRSRRSPRPARSSAR